MEATLQTRVPEKFCKSRWQAERRVPRAWTRERGPPSALAEFLVIFSHLLFVVVGTRIAFTPEGIVVGLALSTVFTHKHTRSYSVFVETFAHTLLRPNVWSYTGTVYSCTLCVHMFSVEVLRVNKLSASG